MNKIWKIILIVLIVLLLTAALLIGICTGTIPPKGH